MINYLMDLFNFPAFGIGPWALLGGAIAGGGWLVAYFDIIRLGFKQKTYGMPTVALALNIVWEFLYAFVYLKNPDQWPGGLLMTGVNTMWAVFDVIILVTHIKYGKEDFKKVAPEKYFHPWLIMALLMAVAIQLGFFFAPFGAVAGNGYTAMIQNIPMSMLYIFLLFFRGSTKGQSMLVAIGKMLGTLGATVSIILYMWDILNIISGAIVFAYDITYTILLYKKFKEEGKNPWRPTTSGPEYEQLLAEGKIDKKGRKIKA